MAFEKCPNCGFTEPVNIRKVSQHMNLYALDDNGKPGQVYGVLNHHEKVVTIEPDKEGAVAFKVLLVPSGYKYVKPEPAKQPEPVKK